MYSYTWINSNLMKIIKICLLNCHLKFERGKLCEKFNIEKEISKNILMRLVPTGLSAICIFFKL